MADSLVRLQRDVTSCRACPRLVEWREQVAVEKRASYRDDDYWGRPVPGFGDPAARIVVLGLAPAAHGANRTGRIFTGDRSGDWLYRAMFRAGLASQPTSVSRDDGLALTDAWVTATVRCAPPGNKPLPEENAACRPFLTRELPLFRDLRVLVCLGGIAYEAACAELGVKPRPTFGHGVEVEVPVVPWATARQRRPSLTILGSYHPSQQNTFTGRLTEPMLDAVFTRAADLAGP